MDLLWFQYHTLVPGTLYVEVEARLIVVGNFFAMHAEPKKCVYLRSCSCTCWWERKQSTKAPPINITVHTFWRWGGLLSLIFMQKWPSPKNEVIRGLAGVSDSCHLLRCCGNQSHQSLLFAVFQYFCKVTLLSSHSNTTPAWATRSVPLAIIVMPCLFLYGQCVAN